VIPQRNVSRLSNRLAAGGELRIREDVLEQDYCLAWLLNALAGSDLHRILALKGGTALKRCYFADYRFSEDLDFTLREALPFESRKDAARLPGQWEEYRISPQILHNRTGILWQVVAFSVRFPLTGT
jgi:predicted nucleotidyltransferase component of viral defense system